MKKYILSLTLCLPLFVCSHSHASPLGINILSQNHHIWGEAGSNYRREEVYRNYDVTSDGPLHSRAEGFTEDFGWLDPEVAESWAGDFRVRTFTQRWNGEALAESTYTFQAESDKLVLDVIAYDDSTHQAPTIWYDIVNTVTGIQVSSSRYDSAHHDAWRGGFLDTTEHLELSINHDQIYELHLFVNGWGGDDVASTYLSVNLESVVPNPEPATILLFSLGLAGFAGLKKKKV